MTPISWYWSFMTATGALTQLEATSLLLELLRLKTPTVEANGVPPVIHGLNMKPAQQSLNTSQIISIPQPCDPSRVVTGSPEFARAANPSRNSDSTVSLTLHPEIIGEE